MLTPSGVMRMKREGDVPALIEAVLAEEITTSPLAAPYLGELGDKDAVDALCKALELRFTGKNAAEALGHTGDARAVGPLARSLHDDDFGIRDGGREGAGQAWARG
jgi:hypothetical protein